ncbi:MAG: ATP-dependent RecD-like DNA helicase [Oscillospiraceae bacterium]|nr:ATP-dependent RecD-like DNA helicase [Oscillospiraceae bacterium]
MNGNESLTELCGTVENVTFRKEETGFSVLDLNSGGELVTVVGVIPLVTQGEELRLTGRWDYHASFGRQFRAETCEQKLPNTAADLLKYLSAGVIKGVGPATALRIVEKFGDEAFDVLENDPRRLASIPGISLSKAEDISQKFKEQFAVREVMIALSRFGMTPNECLKVYKLFGRDAVDTVTRNPYVLCLESIGIGFDRADTIAAAMPSPPDRILRDMAGVIHVIRHNLGNGHTCLPREKLTPLCAEMIGANIKAVEEAVDALIERKQVISEQIGGKEFIFLPHIYLAEKNAAEHIKMILRFPPAGRGTLDEEIRQTEQKENIQYEDTQRLAIRTAIEKGLLILTGGPGTGKTTTLKGIISLFEKQKLNIALAAPTGRAAKRMSEVTGRDAKTIHRLLEVEWDESDRPAFQRNERNPIDANALIVDELSMVDIYVFSSLLKALPIGCRLVLVGDSDQLPPVGAGNVLHDMIGSGLLPVVRLTEVFRQALESLIVTNAHKIVRGETPDLTRKDKDFFFMERRPFAASQTVTELCVRRLPKAYGYSPMEDVQVLCPSRKGECGSNNLNAILQASLNPPSGQKREINAKGRVFREGDKVMQTKNNYNINWDRQGESGSGIFNGDIGVLKKINMADSTMVISFDEREAKYPMESAGELELAYAITVHKSQGSEFPAVVMPVAGVPPQLTYRNLLYTAVTRAKSIIVMVGNAALVEEMARNDKKAKRYSALKHFLLQE